VFCRGFPVQSVSLYKKNVVSLAAAREDDICADWVSDFCSIHAVWQERMATWSAFLGMLRTFK
jgi:hypothetical protein